MQGSWFSSRVRKGSRIRVQDSVSGVRGQESAPRGKGSGHENKFDREGGLKQQTINDES